jgi:O-methyltransferase
MLHRLSKCFGWRCKAGNDELHESEAPPDMEPEFLNMYKLCKPFTMTSIERMYALYKAAIYVSMNTISGDIVECGVWKGGSVMLMAMTLLARGDVRDIYLYDTFAGMSEPSEKDVDYMGNRAMDSWWGNGKNSQWGFTVVSLDDVRRNLALTQYPSDKLHYIEGKVEDTIPGVLPESAAVLHLDTDWYTSTYHEFKYLFPRLITGGVVIIDDYGHHKGAREATDRYLKEHSVPMLLHRVDYTGRVGIKL